MAKKGAAVQLQADLQTDEDLEKFLERPGLLVLDIYSEWCGPCLGMVGVLRKFKLEMGGDNLQLAICKADTIAALSRFRKRSQPTWLFVSNGKAVNLMYGSNVPRILALLEKELEKTVSKQPRPIVYDISELQPIEVEQLRVKTEAIEKVEKVQRETKQKKRLDYLNFVTDTIMENLREVGVTVFGPHVNRDMYKKLTEPADLLKIQCKDRKVVQVSLEDFEIVNYACQNPLHPDVLEQMAGKELLMLFWKVDESLGKMTNILAAYEYELTKQRMAPPDDFHDTEYPIPPIISPMKIKLEIELKEGETWEEEFDSSEEEKQKQAKEAAAARPSAIFDVFAEEEADEEYSEEQEATDAPLTMEPSSTPYGMPFDMDLGMGAEEEESVVEDEAPKQLTRTKTIKMPAIWVPNNRRTHAALIYTFFRGQTTGFLPPDPKPEPPHLIMAFEATKRRGLLDAISTHKDDVPLYGYFNSDVPNQAKLIADTTAKYEAMKPNPTDKIVLKVNKVQSNMMLSLVGFSPTYVSPNVTVGHEEALKFFPEDYGIKAEVVEVVEEKARPSKKTKDKKPEESTKHKQSVEVAPVETAKEETAAAEELPAEQVAEEPAPEAVEAQVEGAAAVPPDDAASMAVEAEVPPAAVSAEQVAPEVATATQPDAEAPAAAASTTEAPAAEAPTAEAPAAEAPAAEAPSAEAHTAEAPAAEVTTAEAPTAEAPTAEAPTAEAAAAEAPVSEAPAAAVEPLPSAVPSEALAEAPATA